MIGTGRRLLLLFTVLCGSAARVAAQPAPPLAPGDRVRLPPPRSTEGTVVSLDSTTLRLRDDAGRSLEVVRLDDVRLLVHAGPGPCSGTRRGWCVLGGVVAGGALGVLGALAVSTNDASDPRVLFVGAPVGAAFGAALGSIVGGDRWRRVDLPAALSIAPSASGMALRARLTF